ncbi:MAG: phospholipid/cholesterol/gamma-HCH transport system ATP-binding protein, partial [Paraburkholderia sp.]|nr:phospholipid/cholesterol/gamma-HCH transport system ATP-binding protein [Paraburkholderia sp.]
NVDFGYGDRLVLSNLSLRFKRGQVVAVMGGSGCGKTTVLRLIGGLVRAVTEAADPAAAVSALQHAFTQ